MTGSGKRSERDGMSVRTDVSGCDTHSSLRVHLGSEHQVGGLNL